MCFLELVLLLMLLALDPCVPGRGGGAGGAADGCMFFAPVGAETDDISFFLVLLVAGIVLRISIWTEIWRAFQF